MDKTSWVVKVCLCVFVLFLGCGVSPNGPQEVGETFTVDLPR